MKLKITVHGVSYEVDVEVLDARRDEFTVAAPLPAPPARPAETAPPATGPAPAPAGPAPAPAGGGRVLSPLAGTVVEVKCREGAAVTQGEELLVIEAMKMNTGIAAPRAGTVRRICVAAGDTVREGQELVELA